MSKLENKIIDDVFGLKKSKIRPIVEAVAGGIVDDYTITVEPKLQGKRGCNALTMILTFNYSMPDEHVGKETVFVKRFLRPGQSEVENYTYLQKFQFPVPRLYGVLYGNEGEEIVFLECLEHICNYVDEGCSLEEKQQLLSLHARLNALPFKDDHIKSVQRWWDNLVNGMVEQNLYKLWNYAEKGLLGLDVQKLFNDSRASLPLFISQLRTLYERVEEMPRALNNIDLEYGRRMDTGEVLVFDWHSLGVGPRYFSVWHILGTPEGVLNKYGRFHPRATYAAYYASELANWSGAPVTVEKVMEETYILWQAVQLFHSGWLVDRCLDGEPFEPVDNISDDIRAENREDYRKNLHSIFSYLIQH